MLTKTEMIIYQELIIKLENNLLEGWDRQLMICCDVRATPRQHALAYAGLGFSYDTFKQRYPFLEGLAKHFPNL